MLRDFRSTVGRASDVLPEIDSSFEQKCLWTIIEAFKLMKKEKRYDLTWKETRFSACLVGYMRKIRDQKCEILRIDPESCLYREEVLRGMEDPDTSPIIDFKISGGWVQEDVYYGIEGKILVENDWGTRRANHLNRRYIDTGIDNFVNGRYSNKASRGCIAGYVVQGCSPEIVLKINNLLVYEGRNKENIEKALPINGFSDCFRSRHTRNTDNKQMELHHIYLTFQ